MVDKVNCLHCTSFLLGLYDSWVEGDRASLSKCVKRDIQIRQPIRHCKDYHKNNYQRENLAYNRAKLEHISKVLDMIEESLDTHEERSTQ